jgi:cytochrome c553
MAPVTQAPVGRLKSGTMNIGPAQRDALEAAPNGRGHFLPAPVRCDILTTCRRHHKPNHRASTSSQESRRPHMGHRTTCCPAVLIVFLGVTGIWVSTPVIAQAAGSGADQPALLGQSLAAARCAVCHGADGNSTDVTIPKLAGQREGYFIAQMSAFQSGTRSSAVMAGVVADLTKAQTASLAHFYAKQSVQPEAVADLALARAGERVFRTRRRGMPSCAACHAGSGFGMGGGMMGGGMGMMRTNPAITPRLSGQHADYLRTQLEAFASGTRKDTVMGPIAATLSQQDRAAVAEYLSGLK